MTKEYKTIQIRRDTLADFVSTNPILSSGEPAIAVDASIFKIGNGVNTWSSLPSYINSNDASALSGILNNQIHQEITSLIDGAPAVLDTLNELASAINDDSNFGNAIINNIITVSGIASSKINGTGLYNYSSKWDNSSTLTSGIIYDDGSTISIGAISTGPKLYIDSNNATDYNFIINSGNAVLQSSLLRVGNSNSTATNGFAGILLSSLRQGTSTGQGAVIACVSTNLSTYSPNIIFAGRSGGASYAEHMRIAYNGYIGIGNNNPQYNLHVSGTGNFDNLLINGEQVITRLLDDTLPQLSGNLDLNTNNISGTGNINIIGSGNFSDGVYSDGSPLIESNTNGISGNVSGVSNIIIVDQTTYDNILTKNPTTIYYII